MPPGRTFGGQGWIRTIETRRCQIYSLMQLTALLPTHKNWCCPVISVFANILSDVRWRWHDGLRLHMQTNLEKGTCSPITGSELATPYQLLKEATPNSCGRYLGTGRPPVFKNVTRENEDVGECNGAPNFYFFLRFVSV